MIKQGVIDLNSICQTSEIPISEILACNENRNADRIEKNNKFKIEEVKVNDSSSSIYFTQHGNKVLINIYGPRETKFRDKAKNDEAIVEVYTKFNYEISKESKILDNIKYKI